jgi:hypothetical protein
MRVFSGELNVRQQRKDIQQQHFIFTNWFFFFFFLSPVDSVAVELLYAKFLFITRGAPSIPKKEFLRYFRTAGEKLGSLFWCVGSPVVTVVASNSFLFSIGRLCAKCRMRSTSSLATMPSLQPMWVYLSLSLACVGAYDVLCVCFSMVESIHCRLISAVHWRTKRDWALTDLFGLTSSLFRHQL